MTNTSIEAMKNKEMKRHNTQQEKIEKQRNANQRRATDIEQQKANTQKEVGDSQKFVNYTKPFTDVLGTVGKAFGNDKKWYEQNKQLLDSVCQIPFFHPLGIKQKAPGVNNDSATPSIAVIRYASTVPSTNSSRWDTTGSTAEDSVARISTVSALTLSAQKMYAFIRKSNSGAAPYDYSDLFMALYASRSAWELYGTGLAILGLINMFDNNNRLMPKMIFGDAFDYQSFRNNKANFVAALNNFANAINAVAIPGAYALNLRSMYLAASLFKDAGGQYIKLWPSHYSLYSDADAAIKSKTIPLNLNVTNFISILDEVAQTFLRSGPLSIINGDIQKAYGNNVMRLPENVNADFILKPTEDKDFICQLQNATIAGQASDEYLGIYQKTLDNGEIDFYQGSETASGVQVVIDTNNQVTQTGANLKFASGDFNFTIHVENLDSGTIAEATRLITIVRPISTTDAGTVTKAEVLSCGSEIIESIAIYQSELEEVHSMIPMTHAISKYGVSMVDYYYSAKFEALPKQYYGIHYKLMDTKDVVGMLSVDYHVLESNYGLFDDHYYHLDMTLNNLANINQVCLQSMMGNFAANGSTYGSYRAGK